MSLTENESKEYLVGYLDIIGFEYLLHSKGLQIIFKSLHGILNDLMGVLKTGKPSGRFSVYGGINIPSESKKILMSGFFNFSDSILLYSDLSENEEENRNKFFGMCWIMNRFISTSILNPNDPTLTAFAFRGAISKGKGFVNNDLRIHMGEPFIRAYRLAESQDWMGGVIDININEEWNQENKGFNKEIDKYNIPFSKKEEKVKYASYASNYALNWPRSHPYDYSTYKWNGANGTLKRKGPQYDIDLKRHIESYDWDCEKNKKDNTLKFAEEICDEWDKEFLKDNPETKI